MTELDTLAYDKPRTRTVLNSANAVLHLPALPPGIVFRILSNVLLTFIFLFKLIKTYLVCRALYRSNFTSAQRSWMIM
jgi:hypothetical protein